MLEERGVPEALSDAGSAKREERAKVMLVCFFRYRNAILSRRRKRERVSVWILFMNTRRKHGLHAQVMGT